MTDPNKIWHSPGGELSPEKLTAYLEGRLSPQDSRAVELWLSEEGMESDAVEGLQQLSPEITAEATQKLRRHLRKTLAIRHDRKKKKAGFVTDRWIWIIVLTVVLLCLVGYIVVRFALLPAAKAQP